LHTLIWAVVLLLPESRAIINDLDVILHGFMLQIISTTVFRVEWLHNLMLHVRSFNSENRGINITYPLIILPFKLLLDLDHTSSLQESVSVMQISKIFVAYPHHVCTQ
jgi:hypothetical protein